MTAGSKTERELRVVRDTVESIWVAIVLAFVLRAFVFEAFVIPTGSMAPRLVGEHWDLVCPCCGWRYAYGLQSHSGQALPSRGDRQTVGGMPRCPNCTYPFGEARRREYVNGGDRVLVLKYIYRFRDPRPWDVVVFKNPQNNRENYIKRLIGLPGEAIELINGDVFFHRAAEGPWRIRRKEREETQRAMWQIVFDNDYQPDMAMVEEYNRRRSEDDRIHPPVWRDEPSGCWAHHDGRRRFVLAEGRQDGALVFDAERHVFAPRYGYNSALLSPVARTREADNVCGDLRLSFTFMPEAPTSAANLILSGLHHRFRAEVRADGQVSLYHAHPDANGGREQRWLPPARIDPLEVGRGYELALAHADYRVTVWVDGEKVLQTSDAEYTPDPGRLRQHLREMEQTLVPIDRDLQNLVDSGADLAAGSGARKAMALHRDRENVLDRYLPTPQVRIEVSGGGCDISHVRLVRDVFYTYLKLGLPPGKGDRDVQLEYARALRAGPREGDEGWGVTGNPIELAKHPDNPDLDEFFVLGDNSPQSLDGRAWVAAAPTLRLWEKGGKLRGRMTAPIESGAEPVYTLGTVPRYNLTGRALFVYWPSGHRVPGLPGLPIIPNVGRMRLIR